jgi:hypothetical protein
MTAGDHVVTWQAGRDLPSGVYLYRVAANGAATQGKVLRVD